MKKLVVIGGDAAGMSAAARASRSAEPPEIVVFERGEYTSYAACGLPYHVSGLIPDPNSLVARTPEEHRANGIDVRMSQEVTSIDTAGRSVTVRSVADGRTYQESYDELLIATGASPIVPNIPNVNAKGVTTINTIPDAVALDTLISERALETAVVIGGGYIGLEMAEALVSRGLKVTLIEMLDQPMATLDPDMSARVADALRELGVSVRLGVAASGFEVDGDGWVRTVTTSAGEIPAELVVLGIGFSPNVNLAVEAGVPLGPSDAIAVNARMATRTPHVWAAGDCVESLHRVSGAPVWVALGTHANKQGRTAGTNLSGTPARFEGVIGTAITRVGNVEIARTGLCSREAQAAGFAAVAHTIEAGTRAHYYPGSQKLAVRVVAERGSGRLLGAQIVGGAESGKRIDALAVGVWSGMTAAEFSALDLAYAPPFSPVWDAILIAARLAGEKAVG
jgi:NADPH-dependent 2,4-dienoyl-CoA reductase/sulfur reductase-like enzyme